MRISDWSSDVCSSDLAADQDRMAALEFGRNAGARLQGSEVLAGNHPNVDAGPPKRIGMSVATFASGILVHDSLDSICGSGHFRRDQKSGRDRQLHQFLQHPCNSISDFPINRTIKLCWRAVAEQRSSREEGSRAALDRKSVVLGKSVSVRVDLGGRR